MVFTTNEQAQLRRIFEAVVSDAGPAPDLEWLPDPGPVAWAQPKTARVRRPGFAIAATIGIVALVTVMVLAITRGGGRIEGDIGGGDGRFPYLLIDAGRLDEGLALVSAFDQETVWPDSPDRLRAYGLPEASPAAARIWFVSIPSGSDFFRGGGFEDDPQWDPIPLEQGRALIRTGPVGSSVMWETGDPGGEVVVAHALMVEPAVLTDVISSMEKDDSGWVPRFLPEGFIELYDGPARADVERFVLQGWTDMEEGGSEIELYLIDSGPDGGERALNEFLSFTVSELEIGVTEVRGKPALVYAIGTETIYQWMETPTVAVRLVIRGPIDPEAVLGALVLVDQATWEATMSDAIKDRVVGPPVGSTTTVAPPTTDP